MVQLASYSLNVGYPVYGARFVNNNTVIIAGGGGDGNNGIPNKMTAVLVQPENTKKPLKRYRELTLNENEDSVMSLDVGNGTIIAGINENPMMMAKGVNKHLRKFKFENDHLKFVESCQIHPNTNSTIYQKITAISHDGSVGVISMSDTPSSIYIVETSSDMEEKFKIVTEGDVKDVTISQDGKLMCYITSNVFEVISLVTGRSVYKTKLDFLMFKVRFLDNNEVIIAGSKSNGAFLAKFSISASKITQQRIVSKNMKGITSMDVNPKNGLIVLATSSYSLLLIRTSDFKVLKVLNKVHEFAITKAVFSEDGKYLASTSAANTLSVVEIPDNFSASKSMLVTIFQYILSIILIAILAIGTQYLREKGYTDLAYNKAIELYESYKPQDSSNYFTVESIQSFKTADTDTLLFTPETPVPTVEADSETHSFENLHSDSFDAAKLTIDGDIVSEVTTSIGYTVSTSSFLDESVSAASVISQSSAINAASETLSETIQTIPESELSTYDHDAVTSTFFSESLTAEAAGETDLAIKSSPVLNGTSDTSSVKSTNSKSISSSDSTEQLPTGSSTAQITAEITKEVTKEITSFVIATQTEISTSYLTSVELLTSVETSVSTEISTSTSIFVETILKEITVTKELAVEATSTPDSTSSTESYEIQIEPEKLVFDNAEAALEEQEQLILDEILADAKASKSVDLETASTDSKIESESTKHSNSQETLNIQIEPSKEVYLDSSEGQNDAAEKAIKEIVSNLEAEADGVVDIQIEPSKEVFLDSNEVLAADKEKAVKEIIDANRITQDHFSIQIEPDIVTFDDNNVAKSYQENKVVEELITDTTSVIGETVAVSDYDKTSYIVESTTPSETDGVSSVVKDEL